MQTRSKTRMQQSLCQLEKEKQQQQLPLHRPWGRCKVCKEEIFCPWDAVCGDCVYAIQSLARKEQKEVSKCEPCGEPLDFDEASAAWRENKIQTKKGIYVYRCENIFPNGKRCRKPVHKYSDYCKMHIGNNKK